MKNAQANLPPQRIHPVGLLLTCGKISYAARNIVIEISAYYDVIAFQVFRGNKPRKSFPLPAPDNAAAVVSRHMLIDKHKPLFAV